MPSCLSTLENVSQPQNVSHPVVLVAIAGLSVGVAWRKRSKPDSHRTHMMQTRTSREDYLVPIRYHEEFRNDSKSRYFSYLIVLVLF